MRFKEEKLKDEFFLLQPKLIKILADLNDYCIRQYDKEILITSLIRTDNKKSVHAYKRGADVRSHVFSISEIAEIKFYVNSRYAYGDSKHETLMHHKVGDGAYHFHIQVKESYGLA